MLQIILGKHLKVGDVIPGGTPEYNRTVREFDYEPHKVIACYGYRSKKKVHPTVGDTYRVVYFQERHRIPMTIFDNAPINILYKKYRRNNKVK
jgi:hypothetical protein